MPLDFAETIAPESSGILSRIPLGPVRPQRLIVDTVSDLVDVLDVRVGTRSLYPMSVFGIPSAKASAECGGYPLDPVTAQPGQYVTLSVHNRGRFPFPFRARVFVDDEVAMPVEEIVFTFKNGAERRHPLQCVKLPLYIMTPDQLFAQVPESARYIEVQGAYRFLCNIVEPPKLVPPPPVDADLRQTTRRGRKKVVD